MSIFSILGGWSRFAKDQRIAELTIDNHLLRERVAYLLEEQASDKRLIAELHKDIAKLHAVLARKETEIHVAVPCQACEDSKLEKSLLEDLVNEAVAAANRLQVEVNSLRAAVEAANRERDLAKMQSLSLRDAVELFAERAQVTPQEIAQLGLGTFVPGTAESPAHVLFYDLEDAKNALDFGVKNQATAAKFRQLKEHFVKHQKAVSTILDGLNELGKKNVVTKEDLRKLRDIRDAVSGMIRRTI